MKKFETGREKIQKICDALRRETLEPAEDEAGKIVAKAKSEAAAIVEEAKAEADRLEKTARDQIAKEQTVFQSSMKQGCRQAVEALKQEIEQELFDAQLGKVVAEATADPQLIASLVQALVGAVEKEGISADLAVVLPKTVKKEEIAKLLLERAREVLTVGMFKGGAKLTLRDQNITIDVSDEALVELLGRYVRKDYREILFG